MPHVPKPINDWIVDKLSQGIPDAVIDNLNTPPTGSTVSISAAQTIADDTLETVDWDTETVRGEAGSVLDDTNNVVVVPDEYDYMKVTAQLQWARTSGVTGDVFRLLIDGSNDVEGAFGGDKTDTIDSRVWGPRDSAWISVDGGEEVDIEVNQSTVSDPQDIESDTSTYMGVWFI